MREAVIVSTARTPMTKAYRGELNNTPTPILASYSIKAAVTRAGLVGQEIEDLTLGCALTQASAGMNLARHAVIASNLPETVAASTVDRQCASGLSAISIAANQIINEGVNIAMAGGVDSISLVQNDHWNDYRYRISQITDNYYMSMIETAEFVAKRYKVTREMQDQMALESQKRTAKAQADKKFDHEIISIEVEQKTSEGAIVKATINKDNCNRPSTNIEGLRSLSAVMGEGATITAGNASQLSDGSSACVLMEKKEAIKRGLEPLATYRGMAVAGCLPQEMGIGPVFAIPKLLKRHGLKINDIDIWEINEAFASQFIYCYQKLDIDFDKVNVNGGSISIGHPYGMTGARTTGHILLEGKRRKAKYAVVSMCIGGGQGAAALFEINS